MSFLPLFSISVPVLLATSTIYMNRTFSRIPFQITCSPYRKQDNCIRREIEMMGKKWKRQQHISMLCMWRRSTFVVRFFPVFLMGATVWWKWEYFVVSDGIKPHHTINIHFVSLHVHRTWTSIMTMTERNDDGNSKLFSRFGFFFIYLEIERDSFQNEQRSLFSSISAKGFESCYARWQPLSHW